MSQLLSAGLLLAGALPALAQEPVTDLVARASEDSIQLTWTTPHACNFMMAAALPVSDYDLRYSTSGAITDDTWAAAIPLDGEPDPLDPFAQPGSTAEMTVTGLSKDPRITYWFAMRCSAVRVGFGDWSLLSNVVSVSYNFIPPAAIDTLSAVSAHDGSVVLAWNAPQDDLGRASAYDLRFSKGPIDETNWNLATKAEGLPGPGAPGADQTAIVFVGENGGWFHFAIKSVDENSNWSNLSNDLQVGVPALGQGLPDEARGAAGPCSSSATLPVAALPALGLAALAFLRRGQESPSNS